MAYYLMVEEKKGKYIALDIAKSKNFNRISKYKGLGLSLQDIDTFTSLYNNIDELRLAMLNDYILSRDNYNKNISIRILRNKEYHKVMYDLMYQKDLEYLINPLKVIERINNKLLQKDFRFILKYSEFFMNYHECSATAPEVRNAANISILYSEINKLFYEYDENNDNLLKRMTKLLIYEYFQDYYGKIFYKDKIKYRNLHIIIAFINNYEKKNVNEALQDNQLSLFTSDGNPKVRCRKKQVIPGQYSLFNESDS